MYCKVVLTHLLYNTFGRVSQNFVCNNNNYVTYSNKNINNIFDPNEQNTQHQKRSPNHDKNCNRN